MDQSLRWAYITDKINQVVIGEKRNPSSRVKGSITRKSNVLHNPKFPRSISLSILALFSLNSVQVRLSTHISSPKGEALCFERISTFVADKGLEKKPVFESHFRAVCRNERIVAKFFFYTRDGDQSCWTMHNIFIK